MTPQHGSLLDMLRAINSNKLGTVLGRTKCANFFVKTYCLWHKQLENEIILGGHRAPFFRKWVRTLLFSVSRRNALIDFIRVQTVRIAKTDLLRTMSILLRTTLWHECVLVDCT